MTDETCLFCKIAAKQIPAEIVYEDEHTVAFLDISPRAPGHTMVIPRWHAPRLLELPDEELGPLFVAVKKMGLTLCEKLGCEGITVGINQGRASGQEVDHLHVHLMPRWQGDGGGPIQTAVNNKPKESLKEIADRIRA